MDGVDVVVIGAGVVGCAVAHALARDGAQVMLLEAGPRLGEGVTSRNSGVIHSGLYYPPGSLKAQTCVDGNARLYAWCAARNVWHRKCGKLVVARHARQLDALHALHANALKSGAPGVEIVDGARLQAMEPSVPLVAALWCPETGIVDPYELTCSLANAAQEHGAMVLTHARVEGIATVTSGYVLETSRGAVAAARVINAAGLHADDVARLVGIQRYQLYPCRGDYFRLRTSTRYAHLIYPVKDPASAGLGVHLTIDRDGAYKLGPDVTYVADRADFSGAPHKLEDFRRAAEALLGPVDASQLSYEGCGIRPKLRAPDESQENDFVINEDLPGFVSLVGIESPGLTAALSIAERVADMVRA